MTRCSFIYIGHWEIRPELGHVMNLTNSDEQGRKVSLGSTFWNR